MKSLSKHIKANIISLEEKLLVNSPSLVSEKLMINKNLKGIGEFDSNVKELYLVRFFPADLSYGLNILLDIVDVNDLFISGKTCHVTGSFYTEGANYTNCVFNIHNDILWRWNPHFVTRLDILLHPNKKEKFFKLLKFTGHNVQISFKYALDIINVNYDFSKVSELLSDTDQYKLCERQDYPAIKKIIKRLEE